MKSSYEQVWFGYDEYESFWITYIHKIVESIDPIFQGRKHTMLQSIPLSAIKSKEKL